MTSGKSYLEFEYSERIWLIVICKYYVLKEIFIEKVGKKLLFAFVNSQAVTVA